jgi:hypothetical protein
MGKYENLKQVFCDDCEYFLHNPFGKDPCGSPENLVNSYKSKNSKFKKYAFEINKDNYCVLYKRKWWKFWVK